MLLYRLEGVTQEREVDLGGGLVGLTELGDAIIVRSAVYPEWLPGYLQKSTAFPKGTRVFWVPSQVEFLRAILVEGDENAHS